jgi:hypothetical protein
MYNYKRYIYIYVGMIKYVHHENFSHEKNSSLRPGGFITSPMMYVHHGKPAAKNLTHFRYLVIPFTLHCDTLCGDYM